MSSLSIPIIPVDFWEVVGSVAAVIAILPLIYKWLKPIPKVKVRLGHYNISNKKTTVLLYLVPNEKLEKVNYLPFPLILSNESDKDINNFRIQITSKAKVDDMGILPRLRLDRDYNRIQANGSIEEVSDSNCLRIQNTKPDFQTSIQSIGNERARQVFPHGTDYPLYIHLTASTNKSDIQMYPWDEFDISVLTDSSFSKEREFKFKIYCYSLDSVNNNHFAKNSENSKCDTYIIRTVFSGYSLVGRTDINDNNPMKVAWYEVSREENSINAF